MPWGLEGGWGAPAFLLEPLEPRFPSGPAATAFVELNNYKISGDPILDTLANAFRECF